MNNMIYYINGMHCNGCVRRATVALMSLSGVNSTDISLVTSKVVINAGREIPFEELSAAISGAGYELTSKSPNFFEVFSRWFKKYLPLITAFSVVILWTLSRSYFSGWNTHMAMRDFMGGFFVLFGGLKVLNWKGFALSFQGYDPLAMRVKAYAYVYPAIEFILGLAYIFNFGNSLYLNIVTVLILGINTVGIIEVKRRREMVKCACLGGYFNIPITWFTVFENGLMIAMAIYMQLFFR